jgi:hypothetical protein
MKHRRKTVGECVYCGAVGVVEKEDVIPKCLFPTPRPNDLVKVPSCRPCNAAKSKDDDYLRDFLVSDISTGSHPVAQSLFHQKVLSSVRQNSSDFARIAVSDGKLAPYRTREGLYLGHAYSIPLDDVRLHRIFGTIVRGLYFKANGVRIPDAYVFNAGRIDSLAFNRDWPQLSKIGFNGPYKIGDGIFTCIWMKADIDPFLTSWWLFFYDSIGIFITSEKSEGPGKGLVDQPDRYEELP